MFLSYFPKHFKDQARSARCGAGSLVSCEYNPPKRRAWRNRLGEVPVQLTSAAKSPIPRRAVILLVEDQAVLRMLIEDVLSAAGHQVFSAPHARLALQLAKEQNLGFDLLVTDVDMPGMSGLELYRCLLSASNPEIRVLFMSGHNVDDLLHSGKIEAGAAFLQKPFLPYALRAAIDDLLISTNS